MQKVGTTRAAAHQSPPYQHTHHTSLVPQLLGCIVLLSRMLCALHRVIRCQTLAAALVGRCAIGRSVRLQHASGCNTAAQLTTTTNTIRHTANRTRITPSPSSSPSSSPPSSPSSPSSGTPSQYLPHLHYQSQTKHTTPLLLGQPTATILCRSFASQSSSTTSTKPNSTASTKSHASKSTTASASKAKAASNSTRHKFKRSRRRGRRLLNVRREALVPFNRGNPTPVPLPLTIAHHQAVKQMPTQQWIDEAIAFCMRYGLVSDATVVQHVFGRQNNPAAPVTTRYYSNIGMHQCINACVLGVCQQAMVVPTAY
jgi:hypothetical protein